MHTFSFDTTYKYKKTNNACVASQRGAFAQTLLQWKYNKCHIIRVYVCSLSYPCAIIFYVACTCAIIFFVACHALQFIYIYIYITFTH